MKNRFYLTGSTATRGGLTMGGLRLWPNLRAAVAGMEGGYGNRIYEMYMGDFSPARISLDRMGLGIGNGFYMDEKDLAKRLKFKTQAVAVAAAKTWELHEAYSKHAYVPIGVDNHILYCPACDGFGFQAFANGKTLQLAIATQDMMHRFKLRCLMEYMQPEMRVRFGTYLKARGYGGRVAENLVELEELMRLED